MKTGTFAAVAAATLAGSAEDAEAAALVARAFAANPSGDYTPSTIQCPANVPSVRSASGLSNNETEWLNVRRNATVQPMRDLLGRLNITGFDTNGYLDKHSKDPRTLPNIGIAISGGGYRAFLNGAGVLEAFDSRTPNSTSSGHLGGLLQSATYLSGLSGGSWLVGSLYTNNFTSISDILGQDTDDKNSGGLWQFGSSIFKGPEEKGINLINSAKYYGDLISAVKGKKDAGYNTSITDIWGRSLSYQLVNATDGGPAYTFSSISQQDWFTSGSAPLPLIVTDSRAPGHKLITGNSTIFTINPWEIGSDDPTLYGFAPLQYIGTNFTGGQKQGDKCVVGYDNVGFVVGTSSTLFNGALIKVNGSDTSGFTSTAIKDVLETILKAVGQEEDDIAAWPNPFYGFQNGTNINAQSKELTLVDGGEDNQNVPLNPLIQPDRHVDVIFAVDSSADSKKEAPNPNGGNALNWPLGNSLVATYERSMLPIGNGTAFPAIPDTNTFVNMGLNKRPTFFGCNSSDIEKGVPLIVYLPNAPYVYNSNTSTLDLEYPDSQRNDMILNGYYLATQSNGTIDKQWPTCVGCAILSRSLHRTGEKIPSVCNDCFSSYCWNGKRNSTTPAPYVPSIIVPSKKVKSAATRPQAAAMGIAVAVMAALAVM